MTSVSSRDRVATYREADSVVGQLVMAVHDTVREVTRISVRQNEAGDTVKLFQVTERDRISHRDRARDSHEKTVIKTDTVFIEKRDSVFVRNGKNQSDRIALHSTLKWIFWIIIALIGLVLIIKIRR